MLKDTCPCCAGWREGGSPSSKSSPRTFVFFLLLTLLLLLHLGRKLDTVFSSAFVRKRGSACAETVPGACTCGRFPSFLVILLRILCLYKCAPIRVWSCTAVCGAVFLALHRREQRAQGRDVQKLLNECWTLLMFRRKWRFPLSATRLLADSLGCS